MRLAKSIRLGVVLPANAISYDDCAADDIVCDLCGNRVFKCVRGEGPDAVHYLSHYHAQSEEARLCEERHASLGGGSTLSGAVSRGQSLSVRLDAIARVLAAGDSVLAEAADRATAACASADGDAVFPMPTPCSILRDSCCNAFRLVASHHGHHSDLPIVVAGTRLLGSMRIASDAIPAERSHRAWRRWTGELTSLLVLAESAPALNRVWASAVAGLVSGGDPHQAEAASAIRNIIGPEGGCACDIDPTALRAIVAVRMIRVVESLDPAMPVPSANGDAWRRSDLPDDS